MAATVYWVHPEPPSNFPTADYMSTLDNDGWVRLYHTDPDIEDGDEMVAALNPSKVLRIEFLTR